MVQNSLVKYIREQIRAGYDTNSIKKYLLKYGYTKSQINEALQFAYPPTAIKHVIHFSKTTIALIIAVIFSLALISVAIFMFIYEESPAQLLDVKLDLISDSIEYGSNLKFTIELINLGKARRYDISLKYEIYNLKDEFIRFQEETMAVETKASSSVVMPLGDIKPGSYYLKTTAFYNDKIAKATASFKIVKKKEIKPEEISEPEIIEPEKPIEKCPISCDDNNECTNDYCNEQTNYQCRHDKIFPCCGNEICEENENYENCLADCAIPEEKEEDIFADKPIWEKIEMIKDIAKSNKEKALQYCKEIEQTTYRYDCFTAIAISSNDDSLCLNIEDQSYKDSCYKEFATENRNSDVCSKIIKDSKRDQCYMDFATKGDYTVCDKLVNKYLKQSCDSLKKLSEVKVPS